MNISQTEGVDGKIANAMPLIEAAARASNGFCIELGIRTGTGSTIALQRGLAGQKHPLHISVDLTDRELQFPPSVSWWHLILGDSRDCGVRDMVILLGVRHHPRKLPGLIFIDTEHTAEQIRAELNLWGELATPETVWLFHDTLSHPAIVPPILDYAASHHWTYRELLTERQGLGELRYGSPKAFT